MTAAPSQTRPDPGSMRAVRARLRLAVLAGSLLPGSVAAQRDREPGGGLPPMHVAPASDEASTALRTFVLAPRLVCDLLAAEPDLCNPVAFSIDGQGAVYVAETFRIKDGVFDTRDWMQWKDDDLACLTVADRLAKYEKHIPDLIPRYAAFHERIRRLVDSDRNGTLDRSTVFADGFAELADGIASGVLPFGGDVFFANIPKLWRLRDADGDGIADERHVVHDGYGVHTSLIGHDLHGLIVGPDRRLWFSIGDRGLHVQQGDRTLAFPHEGAVLRCELDGSDLEVVHRGLRNPQELAFDAHGDLFTGDNNSDGGDRARLVHVVPGADSGWRIGYQWLDDRGAWNREALWRPRHPGQSARILPPIANFADGPSGLAFDPGIGLPERFRGCFFLCDFRGGAASSGVHAIRLQRAGAGYELAGTERVVWRVLATDVDFAPDGSLYVLDWVHGWNKTGKGRIWRVRTPEMANDLQLRATAQLLAADSRARGVRALLAQLAHPDRRVRQQAQFALVDLDAHDDLLAAALGDESRLARQHAIWGLGVLGRRAPARLEPLLPLLDDGDADVRAATARVLGDARLPAAVPALARRLADGNARVAREAALALARLLSHAAAAVPALIELLRTNDDHDPVLRHAAVVALAAAAPTAVLHGDFAAERPAVRRGVLLALARRADPHVAAFLRDPDADVRRDAARAIYETPIAAALPDLAAFAYDDEPADEAFDWRVVNANRVLGQVENGEALVHLAGLASHPARTRLEAIAVLGEWEAPHGQCRVTGNWRPCTHPGAERVLQRFASAAPQLLADPAVAAGAAAALARARRHDAGPELRRLVAAGGMPAAARVAALDALAALGHPDLEPSLRELGADAPVPLRRRAVELLARTAPEQAVPVLASLLADAPTGERQAALRALGGLRHAAAAALLGEWLDRLSRAEVPAALQLDLLEAARAHDDAGLRAALVAHDQRAAAGGPLGPWLACREGGDADAGRTVFHDFEATRCTRCHALGGQGGSAGPALDDVGRRLSRDELLAALITPSARIAEGFGTTALDLHDDSLVVGVVTRDQDGAVTVVGADGKAVDVPWTKIRRRSPSADSAMPAMGGPLSPRQVRDLIEFLAREQSR